MSPNGEVVAGCAGNSFVDNSMIALPNFPDSNKNEGKNGKVFDFNNQDTTQQHSVVEEDMFTVPVVQ